MCSNVKKDVAAAGCDCERDGLSVDAAFIATTTPGLRRFGRPNEICTYSLTPKKSNSTPIGSKDFFSCLFCLFCFFYFLSFLFQKNECDMTDSHVARVLGEREREQNTVRRKRGKEGGKDERRGAREGKAFVCK
jgi:hypothetical protein